MGISSRTSDRRLCPIAISRHSKNLRGIGFEVEEMMKLFLVIIIGLGVVILIIAGSGGLQSLLDDFCQRNPVICGGSITQQQLVTAQNSVKGLVKAINCVENEDQTCLSTGIQKMGLTGLAELEPSGDTTVQCKKDSSGYVCTVNNFQLPQKITNAQQWILGMGDPNFIVYFQSFPKEESDAWQISKSNIVALSIIGSGLLNAAFGAFGSTIGKAASYVGNVAKGIPEKVFAKITSKTGKAATEDTLLIAAKKELKTQIDEQVFGKTVRDLLKSVSGTEKDKMIKIMVDEFYSAYGTIPDKAIVTEKMIKFLKSESSDIGSWSVDYLSSTSTSRLQQLYLSFKDKIEAAGITAAMPGTATEIRYGVVLTAAFLAARADSIDEKFNSVGVKSLGLRSPYNDTVSSELSKPIYVELQKGSLQYNTRFYLASPCKAKLTVKKGTTTCWHSDSSGSCQPGPATVRIGDSDVTVCEKSVGWCNIKSLFSKAKFTEAYMWTGDPNQQIYEAALISENGEVVEYIVPSQTPGSNIEVIDISGTDLYIEVISDVSIDLKRRTCTQTCTETSISKGSPETVIPNALDSEIAKYMEQIGKTIPIETIASGSGEQIGMSGLAGSETTLEKYSFSGPDADAEMARFADDMDALSLAASGTSMDAILISAQPLLGGGTEYSTNYCYWGPNTGAKVVKYSALAAAVVIDVFGTAATGGLGAYAVLAATGAGSAFVEHLADRNSMWPSGGPREE